MNPNPAMGASPAGANAAEALNIPSVLLLVSGGLGVIMGLGSLVGAGGSSAALAKLANDPNTAQFAKFAQTLAGPVNIVLTLLGVALSAFVIFGALKMRSLQGHGLALGAAIVSLIPCTGCCCLGMPVGVWALVVLLKPEVKSQFQG